MFISNETYVTDNALASESLSFGTDYRLSRSTYIVAEFLT